MSGMLHSSLLRARSGFTKNKTDNNCKHSAKELEHFERIRRMFESTDDSKKKARPALVAAPTSHAPAPPLRSSSHSSQQSRLQRVRKGKGKGKASSITSASHTVSLSSDGEDASDDVGVVNGTTTNGHVHTNGEEEDDYIIRTDHLGGGSGSMNDSTASLGSREDVISPGGTNWGTVWSKGKGKGKGSEMEFREETVEDEESMYA